ncbi:TetR/AcrR family transcriptional regulator [Pseudonocardia sp. CA-107938]|uniref:TetR/AcrR family transcriptional regulator n=1 Tax=Pseudonocardia sp. CA-107938 TaxID=3240021 RepID=UPI003D8C73D5
MSQVAGDGRLRADARRNRDRIVAAATRAFAAHGAGVPVEEIARAAGVGVGTVYRRFPDRDALIRAVAQETLRTALTQARIAVTEEPTAWAALARFLGQSREVRLAVRLMMDSPGAHDAMAGDPETGRLRHAMIDVLDRIVLAAQAEGSLRDDVGTGDVATAFVLLVRPLLVPDAELASHALERCLGVMLDGLRAGSTSTLPGCPIGRPDVGP